MGGIGVFFSGDGAARAQGSGLVTPDASGYGAFISMPCVPIGCNAYTLRSGPLAVTVFFDTATEKAVLFSSGPSSGLFCVDTPFPSPPPPFPPPSPLGPYAP